MSGRSQASVGGDRRTPERHRKSLILGANFRSSEWVAVRARAEWIEMGHAQKKREVKYELYMLISSLLENKYTNNLKGTFRQLYLLL